MPNSALLMLTALMLVPLLIWYAKSPRKLTPMVLMAICIAALLQLICART